MRPLLLPGLLDAARHNAAHGRARRRAVRVRARLPPVAAARAGARRRSPAARLPADERHHLGALLTEAAPGGWRTPAAPADFYAAKGLLEALLEAAAASMAGSSRGERAVPAPGPRGDVLVAGERELGWIGELHPLVAREWELRRAGRRPSSWTPMLLARARRRAGATYRT